MHSYPPDFLLDHLLYRDGLILVLDKPAGLPVHAGPTGGPNLEDYVDALRFGLPTPPHLAHRLDRDTSGCLVLGRHKKALRRLGRLFESGQVEKVYWAVVEGHLAERAGRIDQPLRKRSTQARGWWMEPAPDGDGQRAVTDYRVLAEAEDCSLVECRPRTGRTHQLRVHLISLGHPIRGDMVYGTARPGEGLLLHAKSLTLPLYPSRPPLVVEAPLPQRFAASMPRPAGEPAAV
jgi:tRNA pseudouridine32 synthase / 23S rRNA pseudouridine746 synthase